MLIYIFVHIKNMSLSNKSMYAHPQSILYWKTGKMQEIFMINKIKTYIIT
jgi:hypothetical protein